MANRQKWTVQANSKGQTVSRHVMRRLAMKAKREGLVSDWNDVRVLDDGSLMLTRVGLVPKDDVTIIAGHKNTGGRSGWVFRTEREHLDGEQTGVSEFAHDQHVLDGNANG